MKITIGGKEYEASPLKLRHLRQLSKMIEDNQTPRNITFSDIDKYLPFIYESVAALNPDFKREEIDELTIDEFTTVWAQLTATSGIRIVPKGEKKPTEVLTSSVSTDVLPSAAAGPTLQ